MRFHTSNPLFLLSFLVIELILILLINGKPLFGSDKRKAEKAEEDRRRNQWIEYHQSSIDRGRRDLQRIKVQKQKFDEEWKEFPPGTKNRETGKKLLQERRKIQANIQMQKIASKFLENDHPGVSQALYRSASAPSQKLERKQKEIDCFQSNITHCPGLEEIHELGKQQTQRKLESKQLAYESMISHHESGLQKIYEDSNKKENPFKQIFSLSRKKKYL